MRAVDVLRVNDGLHHPFFIPFGAWVVAWIAVAVDSFKRVLMCCCLQLFFLVLLTVMRGWFCGEDWRCLSVLVVSPHVVLSQSHYQSRLITNIIVVHFFRPPRTVSHYPTTSPCTCCIPSVDSKKRPAAQTKVHPGCGSLFFKHIWSAWNR